MNRSLTLYTPTLPATSALTSSLLSQLTPTAEEPLVWNAYCLRKICFPCFLFFNLPLVKHLIETDKKKNIMISDIKCYYYLHLRYKVLPTSQMTLSDVWLCRNRSLSFHKNIFSWISFPSISINFQSCFLSGKKVVAAALFGTASRFAPSFISHPAKNRLPSFNEPWSWWRWWPIWWSQWAYFK